jgi:hypothetical protein
VPGKVKQMLHDTVMKRTLDDLRKRVEGQAGADRPTP